MRIKFFTKDGIWTDDDDDADDDLFERVGGFRLSGCWKPISAIEIESNHVYYI